MSFSGTPLGQGRRLDHSTFLGKPPSNGNRPPSPHRIIPTSYSYGAPTLGSRSPPKPSSPTRERNRDAQDDNSENEPALARFARLKQQQASITTLSSRPGGPKIITSPPNPNKWAVKDTSVNIASAFTQAANDMLPASNPNNSWASGSSRANIVPRSTSVEYEQEARAAISRRLGPPSNRQPRNNNPNSSTSTAKKPPIAKSASLRSVPDSEGEEDRVNSNGRGKSPFEQVVEAASRVLKPATYYLLDRSGKPDEQSNANGDTSNTSNSYDYAAEEQTYQNSVRKSRENQTHKRNRMSTDNKAYKPSASDVESSEEDDDGDRPRRKGKRKGKAGPGGGPLNTLPVINQDKRKKRRGRGSKSHINANGEEEFEESGSDEQSQSQSLSQLYGSQPRISPLPRGSGSALDPGFSFSIEQDSAEQGLNSIPEVDEHELAAMQQHQRHQQEPILPQPSRRSRSRTPKPTSKPTSPPSPRFSIGVILGNIVHKGTTGLRVVFMQVLTFLFFVFGRIVGTIWDVMVMRPANWIGMGKQDAGKKAGKYVVLACVLALAWALLGGSAGSASGSSWDLRIPKIGLPTISWGSPQVRYTAPDAPAGDIAELAERLLRIESALSGLVGDTEKVRAKADDGVRGYGQLMERLGSLEGKISSVGQVRGEVGSVQKDVEVLRERMRLREKEERDRAKEMMKVREEGARIALDEEKLKALEDRVGSVEGDVKEAIELGKKAVTIVPSTEAQIGSTAAWWNKLASGSGSKSGLTIKSSDGQDVTSLIKHLVDNSVSMFSKDTIAKADYALHSGGARVIPSLTSSTLEIRPPNLHSQLLGLVTGNGYAIGRPPITALHHELHVGHCWPFAGGEGQLGVALSAPAYIDEVTVDHVAKEVAFDMTSAPRRMEVWGMVEGKDNVLKVKAWKDEKKAQRMAAREVAGGDVLSGDDDEEYPDTLPTFPPYVRLANFTYDIHSSGNVQTFPVDPEIRALDVDFGIVVLRVLDNWGMDFTCLYRFRVHGTRFGGEMPLPQGEDLL